MSWLDDYLAEQKMTQDPNNIGLMPGLLGDTQPQQLGNPEQLEQLLGNNAAQAAQDMVAKSDQANAQAMQAKNAMLSQREAQENSTMQQAQQAAEQQRQQEEAKKKMLTGLAATAIIGGLGGGAEAAEEGLADDALGSAVASGTEAATNALSLSAPLFSGYNVAGNMLIGGLLGGQQGAMNSLTNDLARWQKNRQR